MDESSPFGAPGDGAGRAVRGGPAPRLHRLGAVPSTQDEAAARLRAGERPPFAVTATRQDAGRGRLGRAFASPEGESLALTYVHRTALDPARRGWFPLAAGLAAVRALDRVVPAAGQKRGTPVGLKWPNDLHTPDGRKLGGILAEARGQDALLLGIGVNLHGPSAPPTARPCRAPPGCEGRAGCAPGRSRPTARRCARRSRRRWSTRSPRSSRRSSPPRETVARRAPATATL